MESLEKLEADLEARQNNLRTLTLSLATLDRAILTALSLCAQGPTGYDAQQAARVAELMAQEQTERASLRLLRQESLAVQRKLRQLLGTHLAGHHHQQQAVVPARNLLVPGAATTAVRRAQWLPRELLVSHLDTLAESLAVQKVAYGGHWRLAADDYHLGTAEIPAEAALLGTGDQTHVYRGECRGKQVAVKTFLPAYFRHLPDGADFRTNFIAECERYASVPNHPNLLLFMGACIDKSSMVFEYAALGSLRRHMDQFKFSFPRRLEVMREVALGLTWLHSLDPPRYHLQLCPSAILITEDFRVKLGQYGAQGQGDHEAAMHTGASRYPYYAAPELLVAATSPGVPESAVAFAACDVYAFGMVVYAIISGAAPFATAATLDELRALHRKAARPPASVLGAKLSRLVQTWWAQDPGRRPTMQAIVGDTLWDDVLLDLMLKGEEGAMSMWKGLGNAEEKSRDQVPKRVPWKSFLHAFLCYLRLQATGKEIKDDIRYQCLRAVLAPTALDGTVFVSLSHFERFLGWFGPVIPHKKEGLALLDSIKTLLQKPWFHGDIDANQANSRLVAVGKVNGFLVRFSTTSKCYTISYVHKKKPHHLKCPPGETLSVIRYVETFRKKNGLSAISYNRKFSSLFEKEKNMPGAYLRSSGVDSDDEAALEASDDDDDDERLIYGASTQTQPTNVTLSMTGNAGSSHFYY
eukprot:TRINITY_DN938_c0_g2_i1.p1 TRINITY_DN938_c0_g2~~TRINITY_DN938_c0_g2_i1.p1  ORF type:complete len:696 (-),score=83.35 TRINITY_DN938_c0_g2_i1:64-2151(-)